MRSITTGSGPLFASGNCRSGAYPASSLKREQRVVYLCMEQQMRHLHSVALAGVVALAATAGPAVADPFVPLELLSTIGIPASAENNQGGSFTAFDISFVDPT